MNAWIWFKIFMNPWLWQRHFHELMNMNWEFMNSMNMKFEISRKVNMNRMSCMNQGFWKICRFHGNQMCFLVVNTQKTEESLSNFQVMFGTLHYYSLPQGKFVNTSEGTSPINSMNVWSWLCQSRESMNMKRILHEFMNMNLKIPKSSWTWIWKYHEFMNMNEDFHEPRKKRHERYEFKAVTYIRDGKSV